MTLIKTNILKNFQLFLSDNKKKKTLSITIVILSYIRYKISKELMMFEVVYRKLLVTNVKKKKLVGDIIQVGPLHVNLTIQ